MRIRCIAVDDEELALDLLEDNILKVPFLELRGRFRDAFEAMEFLKNEQVDLMFLDIQMPDLTGIQMIRSLKELPHVILTTAFEKYAVEGFDLHVVDYLVKPFSFERFLKAVNRVRDLVELSGKAMQSENRDNQDSAQEILFVKADYKYVRITMSEIEYIESLKDYVKIYCGERPVITQMSMKAVEERLPAAQFIRVHRSFIINRAHIKYIQRNVVKVGNREIPIGDLYRDQFFDSVNLQ
jgi:DNA-binding LytR/AlgR family response regulator